jgi:predicted N-acetyltransferase YhbS
MANGKLVIRSYNESDEAAVIGLWREVFPDNPPWNDPKADILRKLGCQRELFLVGELQKKVVATVMAGFDGHRGWVHLVAVSPTCRQQGIGRAVMREAEIQPHLARFRQCQCISCSSLFGACRHYRCHNRFRFQAKPLRLLGQAEPGSLGGGRSRPFWRISKYPGRAGRAGVSIKAAGM